MEVKKDFETPYKSALELRDAVEGVHYSIPPEDSNLDMAKQFLGANKKQLVSRLKDNVEFWQKFYDKFLALGSEKGQISESFPIFEKDGYKVRVTLWWSEGKVNLNVSLASIEWVNNSMAFNKSVFGSADLSRVMIEDKRYSFSSIAEKINLEDFENIELDLRMGFSVEGVKDLLGMGVDKNIAELVHYLNRLGLKTEASCGGHEGRSAQPYIAFSPDSLSRLLPVLFQWRKEGGKVDDSLVPFSGSFGETDSVRITYPKSLSLKEAQKDLEGFLVFLKGKFGEIPENLLGVQEKRGGIWGKIRNIFDF